MINTLAINNYRSLIDISLSLGQLNVITGANGSGKTNLYRALRLLAQTVKGGVTQALAKEGGLDSTYWAGPQTISRQMQTGEVPIQGGPKRSVSRLRLGFYEQNFSYAISLGFPIPSRSAFALDPEIKRETIWAGPSFRPASVLIDRDGAVIKIRAKRQWQIISKNCHSAESLFSQIADPIKLPELSLLRQTIASWRFYDQFRSDADAPARQAQLGTWTPTLSHDGHDLAAALQTIKETGDSQALDEAIADAFPQSSINIRIQEDGRFNLEFYQHGLLRPLSAYELSDGTLRYLLWVAALLSPRPAPLLVVNEPENSLHPDLLPALARLIIQAAENSQIWVISHASRLIATLENSELCNCIKLEKEFGQTKIKDRGLLEQPYWNWPDKRR